jgi:hypothetical protein
MLLGDIFVVILPWASIAVKDECSKTATAWQGYCLLTGPWRRSATFHRTRLWAREVTYYGLMLLARSQLSVVLKRVPWVRWGRDTSLNDAATCTEEPVFLRPHISRDSSLGGVWAKSRLHCRPLLLLCGGGAGPTFPCPLRWHVVHHLPDLPTLATAPIRLWLQMAQVTPSTRRAGSRREPT